jgi:hypothetical protein
LFDLPQVVEWVIASHNIQNVDIPHREHGYQAQPESKSRKKGNKADNDVYSIFFKFKHCHQIILVKYLISVKTTNKFGLIPYESAKIP